MTLAWKKNRAKALAFSMLAVRMGTCEEECNRVRRQDILTDVVIRGGGIVCFCLMGKYFSCHILSAYSGEDIASLIDRLALPTSICCKHNILLTGGFSACSRSIRISSSVFFLVLFAFASASSEEESRAPRCFSGGIFLLRASGGCIGS